MIIKERISQSELIRINTEQLQAYQEMLTDSKIRQLMEIYDSRAADILLYLMRTLGQRRGLVLDVGAGAGYKRQLLLEKLCRNSADYHGIDPIPVEVRGIERSIERGLIEHLPKPFSFSFDYVFASHVLEHCQDPERAIQAIAGALHTGGILGQVTPAYPDEEEAHRCYLTLDEWEELHKKEGLTPLIKFIFDAGEVFPEIGPTPFAYLISRRDR